MSTECLPNVTEIAVDLTSLSHWAFFPPMPETDRFASPQTFRVLVASVGGRFAIATVSLRTAPDASFAGSLASLIDDPEFWRAPIALVVGEYWRRTGQPIELHDVDLEQDNPLLLTSAISRAVARLARTTPSGFTKQVSLIQMKAELAEQFDQAWLSMRQHFVSGLSQEAVAYSRGIDGLKPSTYALINSTQDPVKRHYRIQALTLWPMLQPVLLTQAFAGVLSSIDAGAPLVDALADHLNVPKVMIRTLREVTPETLGSLAQNIHILFELLREIPVDFFPRDMVTWKKFVVAVDTIKKVSHREITSSANKLWLRHCARKAYELPVRTPEDLVQMGQQIDTFLTHLLQTLSWAVSRARKQQFEITRRASEVVTEFRAEIGLDGLARLARRFDDAYRRAYDAFAQEAELWVGVRWPALAGGTHTFGNVLLVQLLTPEELRTEGKAMSHCAALYVEYCITGSAQVWSIQHRDGKRLATLDTSISSKPNGAFELKIRQCVGRCNSAASQLAMEAANDLVLTLSNDPGRMTPFVDWQQTVRRKSLDARQRHALMQPIANALDMTLSGKYAWPKLIAMVKPI